MGCSVSHLNGPKNDDISTKKKLHGNGLKVRNSNRNSFKKKRSFRYAPPVDLSESCCTFAEKDEFVDIKITRATPAVALANINNTPNVSASLITVDSSFDLDEKCVISQSATITASHSSQNLDSAEVTSKSTEVVAANPNDGNLSIPLGHAVYPHGVANNGLPTDGATSDGMHRNQHYSARSEDNCPFTRMPCDLLPSPISSSPTSMSGNGHLNGFSSPFTSAPTSPSARHTTDGAKMNSSTFADNLDGVSSPTKCTLAVAPTTTKSSSASGSERNLEDCSPLSTLPDCATGDLFSPSFMDRKRGSFVMKSVMSNISVLTALDENDNRCDDDRVDNDEVSPESIEEHDRLGYISLTKLKLPPASDASVCDIVTLQTCIPFVHSPEASVSDLNREGDEVDELHSSESDRLSKLVASSRGCEAARESVMTSVSKIEVMSKGRRPPALHVNTSWEADKASRVGSGTLQPLSPNKFPSRSIASVGRHGSSEKTGEMYIVGGFRDAIQSTRTSPTKVKDIVAQIQSAKPAPPPRRLSQYFTPVPQKNRHKRESTESMTRSLSVCEYDDVDPNGSTLDSRGDKALRSCRTVGSLLSRTDYTAAPKALINSLKSFHFSPSKEVDIYRVTTCDISRSKRASGRWGIDLYPDSPGPGTPRSATPAGEPRPLDHHESVQSLFSYAH